jgi:hypothetical protein
LAQPDVKSLATKAANLAGKQAAKSTVPHTQKGISAKTGKVVIQDHTVRLD